MYRFALALRLASWMTSIVDAREIVFPPVAGIQTTPDSSQESLGRFETWSEDAFGSAFKGLTTFANLPYVQCFRSPGQEAAHGEFDIAILGAPFDTGVTARPGARYGPSGIRAGSRRLPPGGSWSVYTGENPYADWATIVDCGDAPLTFLDNTVALKQLEKAHHIITSRTARAVENSTAPRIITLGGDHTTTLPALRAAYDKWGKVTVLHFDSHIDTWNPKVLDTMLN
ncbi:MAG: hypothetical protein M4579_007002 [Chaenotheca gracillima]|nr:MAG: hypothetical protein M4579_007002 [Chaenotheca gracillima]